MVAIGVGTRTVSIVVLCSPGLISLVGVSARILQNLFETCVIQVSAKHLCFPLRVQKWTSQSQDNKSQR